MKFLQRALLTSAMLVVIAAGATLQPFKANAQSSQSPTLDELTVEHVRDLRDQVLKKRAAAQRVRGAAFDQRSNKDVDRALRADTDLFFDERSRDKARALREACLAQVWSTCTELGHMYEAGEGTWIDDHLAFAFYVTACFEKDIAACMAVSWDWRIDAASGRYEGHAPYSAVITEACENGHAESCYRLSSALKYGHGSFSINESEAATMLERACDLGSDDACKRLPKTPAEEAAQRSSECASGRNFSCYVLGKLLIAGNGIQTNQVRGESLIRQSCDHGEGLACAWVVEKDALDTIAQADLLEQGCEAQPGRICNDAARLFQSLPDTPENIARFDQVMDLACSSPHAYCLRRFWVRVDMAVADLDPFDPSADKRFADASSAARLRENCASGAQDACHQLAELYKRDTSGDRSLLAAHVLRPSCEAGDGPSCLLIDALMPLDTRARRAIYQQACHAGAVEGCLRLALLDPEKTPAERLVPVQYACSDGYMFACRMQAELLTDQAGRFQDGRTDRERAKALFLFACENDDADACYRYARILAERSRSNNADAELIDIAISYWERACLAGHADACRSLGYEYEDELTTGNPKNLDLSIHFHERACALDSGSCEGLALVNVVKNRNTLRSEHGVLKSALMSHEADFKEEYRARVRRYRRDCEAGDMEQCINLGERYVDALEVDGVYGLPHSTPRDRVWALALYGLACDAGNAAGCEAFAAAFEYVGMLSDPEIALTYSQKGCTLGAAEGCYRLGDFHLKGEHVARDLATADRYFRKACNFGMEDACKRLADGELMEANLSNPHDRLIFACVHGDWYACSRLRDSLRQMSFLKRSGDLIREFENIACDEGDEEMCRNLGRTQND